MKRALTVIAAMLCFSTTVFAQGPPASQPTASCQPQAEGPKPKAENHISESSLGEKLFKKDKFGIPSNLRLELGANAIYVKGPYYRFLHVSPFVQIDYRLLDFLYLYAIIATQYSNLSYDIPVGGGFDLTLGSEDRASFVSGGGIRLVLYRHKRFRIEVFGQYQSINESEAKPKNITLKYDALKLDFNEVFKGHGYLDYSWQFVHMGAKVQVNLWRFRPYIVGGYSWLLFRIKIKIDDYATNAIKLLTSGDLQQIVPERHSETRGNPILYIGTEFRVTKHLSLNIAGMAYPAKEAIYFGQFSIIISN